VAAAIYFAAGCRPEQDGGTGASARAGGKQPAAEIDLEHPVVRIDTNLGAITVRLDAVRAPGTVRNFLNYMSDGFYSNTLFHYVDAEKMIVGGGYSTDGQLKPTQPPIRNEAHNGVKNVRGTIAMARDAAAGIDSATSQFFINLADAPSLDHRGETPQEYGYCVFGEVIDGLDVAERVSRAPTRDLGGDLAQSPDPPVVIRSIDYAR
jgi:cyclophilin family peptidyl-prolyl cis-trans isomerase